MSIDSYGFSIKPASMDREVRKVFKDVVAVSLNPDQLNVIAREMDPHFDIRTASGFGHVIAIPGRAAVDSLIEFLETEERVVRFLEKLFAYDGKFLYDGPCRIIYKEAIVAILKKAGWIYDADLARFLLDSFVEERLNFLKDLELIDVRTREQQEPARLVALAESIRLRSSTLRLDHLNWQITVRANRLSGELPAVLREVVSALLIKQNLSSMSDGIFKSLMGIAYEARNRLYRAIFEKSNPTMAARDYEHVSELFREELDSNGDVNASKIAEKEDLYFDLNFKSSENAISCWTITYIPMPRVQKLELIGRIGRTADSDSGDDIGNAKGILSGLTHATNPAQVVFYPTSTKVGFYLRRNELRLNTFRGDPSVVAESVC